MNILLQHSSVQQADNAGILTIATTNHPERIDDAIINRPSRFDVKYDFTLPDTRLRTEFAVKWLTKVNDMAADTGLKFDNPLQTAETIASKTEGWSFAFLKELCVILRCVQTLAHMHLPASYLSSSEWRMTDR